MHILDMPKRWGIFYLFFLTTRCNKQLDIAYKPGGREMAFGNPINSLTVNKCPNCEQPYLGIKKERRSGVGWAAKSREVDVPMCINPQCEQGHKNIATEH